ncbi:MAG: 39S ribosomal protein L45 [Proteobacteria bacterium]|nr:39S ribosomal protein L45 [Pseudomonadota bacterium]
MDIIFFAALAFFIFFKLSKQLGKIDEEEKKNIEEKLIQMRSIQEQVSAQMKQKEKIIGASSTQNKSEEKILSEIDPAIKESLLPILQRCNISADFFVSGAKSAFEMVLKAFAGRDLEVLKFLLAENIFVGFEAAINQHKAEGTVVTTNLISIDEAQILSATMLENNALITVKFVSKQINYITKGEGNIIVGRKDEISEITDVWTFKRDINSTNPNWIVSATN